jgi:hypothetical protein
MRLATYRATRDQRRATREIEANKSLCDLA